MALKLKSTEAQQNFGAMLDRAMVEDDVIVERYGTPRVAIVAYQRYQELVDAQRELTRLRLQQVAVSAAARAAGLSNDEIDDLIRDARNEVQGVAEQ